MKTYLPSDPERPSMYNLEDGRVGFRASELGKCPRALVLGYQGYAPEKSDDKSNRNKTEGNIHEPYAVRWFEKEFGGVVQRQVEASLNFENFTVGGVTDGIWFLDQKEFNQTSGYYFQKKGNDPFVAPTVIYKRKLDFNPDVFGFEVKAPDDYMFNFQIKNGPNPVYRWQMSIYWAALEETLGIKLSGFVFVMRRRRDGMEHSEIFSEPFYTEAEIKDRVREIYKLSSCDYQTIDCNNDFFCNFWRYHKNEIPPELKAAEKKIFDANIAGVALEYYKACGEIEVLEAKKRALKEDLEIAMRGREKVRTHGFSLYKQSRSFVDVKSLLEDVKNSRANLDKYQSFDPDKFFKENPDQLERYTRQGKPSLVVRALKSLGKEHQNPPVEVRVDANSLTQEEMDYITTAILGEMGEID